MKWSILAVGLVGALGVSGAAGDEAGKADKDEMLDTWDIAAAESGGEKGAKDEHVKDDGSSRFIFTADALTGFGYPLTIVLFGERNGRQPALTWKIDPDKRPKEIDVTFDREGKRATLKGIYSLRGDKLKICFDLSGKGRPGTFATQRDDGRFLVFLVRE